MACERDRRRSQIPRAHNTRRVPGQATNSCTFYPASRPDAFADVVKGFGPEGYCRLQKAPARKDLPLHAGETDRKKHWLSGKKRLLIEPRSRRRKIRCLHWNQ